MPSYRLLALDIDGTLLDREGGLRPSTASAVARAAAAGLRPVLCTGRRYRKALSVARRLGIDAPLVCNSGALVRDPADDRTLWRADLDPEVLDVVLRLLRGRGEPAASVIDRGDSGPALLVPGRPTGRPLFDEYVERNAADARVVDGWMRRPHRGAHFHLFAVGEGDAMASMAREAAALLGDRVRTFVLRVGTYGGTFCEVIRGDAGKWAAVRHLAERWGIDPSEIVAVGDDVNDLPMIEGAALGVAMGHAPAHVREAADHVTGDHDADGVAQLIDRLIGGGGPDRGVGVAARRSSAEDEGRSEPRPRPEGPPT